MYSSGQSITSGQSNQTLKKETEVIRGMVSDEKPILGRESPADRPSPSIRIKPEEMRNNLKSLNQNPQNSYWNNFSSNFSKSPNNLLSPPNLINSSNGKSNELDFVHSQLFEIKKENEKLRNEVSQIKNIALPNYSFSTLSSNDEQSGIFRYKGSKLQNEINHLSQLPITKTQLSFNVPIKSERKLENYTNEREEAVLLDLKKQMKVFQNQLDLQDLEIGRLTKDLEKTRSLLQIEQKENERLRQEIARLKSQGENIFEKSIENQENGFRASNEIVPENVKKSETNSSIFSFRNK